jgi:exopolysaccharide biosynthesis polyprenyl glycosylphosphotransferase
VALAVRFGAEEWGLVVADNTRFLVASSLLVPTVLYVAGLYGPRQPFQTVFGRVGRVALGVAVALAAAVGVAYLSLAEPLGRGAVFLGGVFGFAGVAAHHLRILYMERNRRERVAYVVGNGLDVSEADIFEAFGSRHLELVGLVEHGGYRAESKHPVLGDSSELVAIVERHRIKRILCTTSTLTDIGLNPTFCRLRYSGVAVVPLITLCEEIDQCIPLELVGPEWLLHASGEPHLLYIDKIKRLFDLVVSLGLLLLLAPLLVAAALAVRLTSRGPILYRQVRAGRFGRPFEVIKLRTMRVDAEAGGAVWSSGKDDPRLTPVGGFLRRYRLDEIPQLFNVLIGEMSFVGPRPERPEMIERLAREIPFYLERSLVHPGLTGWAQVNYPYGSSVEDTRRKLEYDLYYMKNMSLFLDVFILFDTVRIVVCGGVSEATKREPTGKEALRRLEQSKRDSGRCDAPVVGAMADPPA